MFSRLVLLAGCAGFGAPAVAQLSPSRTYFGFDKPVMLDVADSGGKGELSIKAYRGDVYANPEPEASVSVVAGKVDLRSAFEGFWTRTATSVKYLQLYSGTEALGSPVVVQPMRNPASASINPQTGGVMFAPAPPQVSGVRIYKDQHVVLNTTLGEIEIRFRPDQAPNTAWNFRQLVADGFYTDIPFHRIIGPRDGREGFMAQSGDPTGTGGGGPGYNIDIEPSRLPHDIGVISMARSGEPNSAGSQFFLCFSRKGTNFLDGNYCAFGETVRGKETIKALESVKVEASPSGEPSKPVGDPPKIIDAKLVDAPPILTGPRPISLPEPESPKAQ